MPPALTAGIFFVNITQAEPGRNSRSGLSFFCLDARAFIMGIFFIYDSQFRSSTCNLHTKLFCRQSLDDGVVSNIFLQALYTSEQSRRYSFSFDKRTSLSLSMLLLFARAPATYISLVNSSSYGLLSLPTFFDKIILIIFLSALLKCGLDTGLCSVFSKIQHFC